MNPGAEKFDFVDEVGGLAIEGGEPVEGFGVARDEKNGFVDGGAEIAENGENGGELVLGVGEVIQRGDDNLARFGGGHGAGGGAFGQFFEHDRRGVLKPVAPAFGNNRQRGKFFQAAAQGEQIGREIAAIDGGDVAGRHGRAIAGGVPIVKMAAVALQFFQRGEGVAEAIDQVAAVDVAEVVGGEDAQEAHADVGGAGALGDARGGDFLEIVGGKPVLRRGHELVVEGPGAAGEPAKERGLIGGDVWGAILWRDAQRPGEEGRGDPGGRERGGSDVGFLAQQREAGERTAGDEDIPAHLQNGFAQAQARGTLGVVGGGPLEEAGMGDHLTPEDLADGAEILQSHVREENQFEDVGRQLAQLVGADVIEVGPPGKAMRLADE